jgi:coproporphyrinogen III oxidase
MGMSEQIHNQQQQAEKWFKELRNQMVGAIQKVDGSTFQEKNGKDQVVGAD